MVTINKMTRPPPPPLPPPPLLHPRTSRSRSREQPATADQRRHAQRWTLLRVLGMAARELWNQRILDRLDTCQSNSVVHFLGFPSTSASSSDIYQYGITMIDSKKLPRVVDVVMKLFRTSSKTLVYEARALESLFKLYTRGYTRNVALVLGRSDNCSYTDVLGMAKVRHVRKRFRLSLLCMACHVENRPAIDEIHDDDLDEVYESAVNEIMASKSPCVAAVLRETQGKTDPKSVEAAFQHMYTFGNVVTVFMDGPPLAEVMDGVGWECDDNVIEILFQVVYTVFVMNMKGIYHRDLHLGNIILDKVRPGETRLTEYRFYGKSFLVDSPHVPRIIDMDRSYVFELGHNPLFKDKTKERRTDDMYDFLSSCARAAYVNKFIGSLSGMIKDNPRWTLSESEIESRRQLIDYLGTRLPRRGGDSPRPKHTAVFTYQG